MCRAVAVRSNAAGKGRGITAGRAHLMPYTAMSSLISIAVETSGSCSAGEVPVRCRFGFSGGEYPPVRMHSRRLQYWSTPAPLPPYQYELSVRLHSTRGPPGAMLRRASGILAAASLGRDQ